jgi:hypothetical protein
MSAGLSTADDAVAINAVGVTAYTVPTDGPDGKESDGTLEWSSTTIVVVEVSAGGKSGIGYTYGHTATVSAHCAPAVSSHAFCAVERLRHLEYFHDHVRLEQLLFDGPQRPKHGVLRPDPNRPGLGLSLKRKDAEQYLVFQDGEVLGV